MEDKIEKQKSKYSRDIQVRYTNPQVYAQDIKTYPFLVKDPH